MRQSRIGGRRIEPGPIWKIGLDGLLHLVVDLADHALRAIFAVCLPVVVADDWERVHDVVHVLCRNPIEVKEGRVQFAAKKKAACGVPAKGRAVPPHITAKRLEVTTRISEFEDAWTEPVADRGRS